uniref:Uncharacterized protein n=1 Tax=Heterorhabditis bacteriophora TaxID=37862 RepID=A0A1I7W955_HETBA
MESNGKRVSFRFYSKNIISTILNY